MDLEEGIPAVAVAPETVRFGLTSDRPAVRTHATTVAAGLAHTDPASVRDLAPALREALADDKCVAAFESLTALSRVASDDLSVVLPAVARLVALLDHDLHAVRATAAGLLGEVAADRPDALTDHVDALVVAAAAETADFLVDRSS